jgi:hypothetical protein
MKNTILAALLLVLSIGGEARATTYNYSMLFDGTTLTLNPDSSMASASPIHPSSKAPGSTTATPMWRQCLCQRHCRCLQLLRQVPSASLYGVVNLKLLNIIGEHC